MPADALSYTAPYADDIHLVLGQRLVSAMDNAMT